MCDFGIVLGLIIINIYCINFVESQYRFGYSPLNDKFISKDLSASGLNVYLEEFDFIPREISTRGRNVEVCKAYLKKTFENHVYALCDHFKCDIALIATRTYNKRVYPLTVKPEDIILPKTEDVSEGQRRSCELAKLAARCSSYLEFANCVYDNYIEKFKVATSHIALDLTAIEVFKKYPNNNLINNYNLAGGGGLSFLFREFLQTVCSFVHNSCPHLHPQFKGATDYFWSQACVLFDNITPFTELDQLFVKSVDENSLKVLVSKETESFLNYNSIESDLILSQLNIPLEDPYNKDNKLVAYMERLFKHRCDLVKSLYVRLCDYIFFRHTQESWTCTKTRESIEYIPFVFSLRNIIENVICVRI